MQGHLKSTCTTPYCDRCRSFGHEASSCKAPCLKCKLPDHHWKDCTVRSYAFIAATVDSIGTVHNPSSDDAEATIVEEVTPLAGSADLPEQLGRDVAGEEEVHTGGSSFRSLEINSAGETVDEASFNSAMGVAADTDPYDALCITETKRSCDAISTSAATRTPTVTYGPTADRAYCAIEHATGTCSETDEPNADDNEEWRSGRRKKRKNVSRTPETAHSAKKAAGDEAHAARS